MIFLDIHGEQMYSWFTIPTQATIVYTTRILSHSFFITRETIRKHIIVNGHITRYNEMLPLYGLSANPRSLSTRRQLRVAIATASKILPNCSGLDSVTVSHDE